MEREEIKKIIPHREPMLLVDSAEVRDGVAYGKYTVKGDEWFLQGHFPGNPVVPGVVLCEMMGQACCVLMSDEVVGSTPYFTGLDKVKFRNTVKPGDTLETQCTIVRNKGPFYFAESKGFVNGKLCVSAEFSFMIQKGM